MPPPPGTRRAPERTAQATPRRVLVVDDERLSTASRERLLRMQGHEVRTGYDGLAAVEVAEAFRPDVALLDIGLPKLTGWGQETDRYRSTAAGFDHHLVKPVDPSALVHLLASLPVPQ